MSKMRAKLVVAKVEEFKSSDGEVIGERLNFNAVAKSSSYPADGSDEDNTYAKFSPDATLSIYIANSALFGHFEVGQKYYLDFTPADDHL